MFNVKYFLIQLTSSSFNVNKINTNINIDFNSNYFSEKNCDSISLTSEYLFCCTILGFIKCFKINKTDYATIKIINLSIPNINSHLTIKKDENFIVFFYIITFSYI